MTLGQYRRTRGGAVRLIAWRAGGDEQLTAVMNGLIRALKRKDEPVVEMLDVDTLKSRIGEPLPPKKPALEPPEYVRTDSRPKEERSWRKVAGLTR